MAVSSDGTLQPVAVGGISHLEIPGTSVGGDSADDGPIMPLIEASGGRAPGQSVGDEFY